MPRASTRHQAWFVSASRTRPLIVRRRADDLDHLVRQQRQRHHGQRGGDQEGDPPVDVSALEEAAQQQGGRDAQRQAGAVEAEQPYAADRPRVCRDEEDRQAHSHSSDDPAHRQHPEAVADRDDQVPSAEKTQQAQIP